MAEFYPPIEFEASENAAKHSRELYYFIRDDMKSTQHADRFSVRPFTLEPSQGYPSPLDIDRPYCEPIATTDAHRLWIAKTCANLVMPRQDSEALLEGMHAVYERDDVQAHLQKGGSLKFIDSHRTYVGLVVEEMMSWRAQYELGLKHPDDERFQSPESRQLSIVSRLVSLFDLNLIPVFYVAEGVPHHGGMIMEDVLLRFGGALQTIPNSATWRRMTEAVTGWLPVRTEAIEKVKSAYEQKLNQGRQVIFEGSSGTENKLVGEGKAARYVIGEVKDATAELTTAYNQTTGAERIMAIPVFIDADPFTGSPDNPLEARPTSFAILEPRFPKTKPEFTQMMSELAGAGSRLAGSDGTRYKYEGKRYFGKGPVPNIFFKHAA